MTTHNPHCDDYDAVVRLDPSRRAIPSCAFAIVKKSYAMTPKGLTSCLAQPLRRDPWDPACEPRIPLGSDYWWLKRHTDVVIEGCAHNAGGVARERAEVCCEVGARKKRVAVFGRRQLEWTRCGRPSSIHRARSLPDQRSKGAAPGSAPRRSTCPPSFGRTRKKAKVSPPGSRSSSVALRREV